MTGVWVADLEADGLLDTATTVWCGVFKDIETGEIRKFEPSQPYYLHYMMKFMDTVPTLVMHNGLQYDFPLLEKLYGYKYKGNKIDTLVWSRLLKPKRPVPYNCPVKNRPHSVLTWGYRVGRGKPDHKDWSQYSEAMLHRCTEDVEIQHLIYNELLSEMSGYDWNAASWLTGRLFEILGMQEQFGWLVDRDWMNYIIHMTTRWIDRIDSVLAPRLPLVLEIQETKEKGEYKYVKKPFLLSGLYNSRMIEWHERVGWNPEDRLVGGPFTRVLYRPLDPASRVEAIRYLLDSGWIPQAWNVNDDGVQTSPKMSKSDPFEGVEGKEGKLLAKRVQIRHRRSSVEGLIKLIRPDGRIASRVTNLAETGRATHGGVVNVPNAENFLGRWMRKIFIVPEGRDLIGCDADSCQARMGASRVKNDAYTRTILEGNKKDKTTIHFLNQKALREEGLNVPYGNCKNLQFAFMFGATDNKLGSMVGGTMSTGEKVRRALYVANPGLEDTIAELEEEWRSNAKTRTNKWGKLEYYDGWIRGLDGRPIFIDSPHKIFVYMLQSDEAITMATAYVFLYDWLEQEGLEWGKDWAYVCWYHDEYQIECDPQHTPRIKFLAEQAINAAGEHYNLYIPQIGEAEVGKNWAETH